MRRLLIAAALLGGVLAWSQQSAEDRAREIDPELRAMRDELARARTLSLPNLESPYFIQYLVDESTNFTVTASLGGLVTTRTDFVREPEILVRVGDYSFDNSNYAGSRFGSGSRYGAARWPIENRYDVLRRLLWLQTDSAYKSAVEATSRKRAALRNITSSEKLNDFAHSAPTVSIQYLSALAIDKDRWTDRTRAISALFVNYPEVKNSSVELESSAGGFTMVNSEGSEVREPDAVSFLRIRASAQAADGMDVRDIATFHAVSPMYLPGQAEAELAVKTVAENVLALAKAPRGEDYSGPVLFEGIAGPQIFAELMGRNFAQTRRPVSDGGRGGGSQPSEFEGRIGARVLPNFFDVVDDPTQTEWRGRPLFGHYTVDREGVRPKPLRLVEKGVLKGYLLTRQPVRGYEGSNGRARLPGSYGAATANISNLFIHASETVPAAELKKKLLELCAARGKPYGIVVRKMDYPSTASFEEARRLLQTAEGGRPVSLPLLVYKVFPDGREELVRGIRFRGLNARSLKDILAAGDDEQVFEFMDNPAPFALTGASGFTAEVAVIAPSILVDDLELHPLEDALPKPPVVPAPELLSK